MAKPSVAGPIALRGCVSRHATSEGTIAGVAGATPHHHAWSIGSRRDATTMVGRRQTQIDERGQPLSPSFFTQTGTPPDAWQPLRERQDELLRSWPQSFRSK